MKKFKVSLSLIFLIIVVVVLGLGYGYLQGWFDKPEKVAPTKPSSPSVYMEKPQPGEEQIIPTADPKWNLYRNFKYGFQIQYPAEWRVAVYSNRQDEVLFGFRPTSYLDDQIVLDTYTGKSLDIILNKERADKNYKSDQIINLKNRQVIKLYDRNPYLDYDSYSYILNLNKKSFILNGGGSPANSWYVDRMIETLDVF